MSKRMLVLMCSIFLIVPLLFMGCGSDGSNGATGATGATGGTGATGATGPAGESLSANPTPETCAVCHSSVATLHAQTGETTVTVAGSGLVDGAFVTTFNVKVDGVNNDTFILYRAYAHWDNAALQTDPATLITTGQRDTLYSIADNGAVTGTASWVSNGSGNYTVTVPAAVVRNNADYAVIVKAPAGTETVAGISKYLLEGFATATLGTTTLRDLVSDTGCASCHGPTPAWGEKFRHYAAGGSKCQICHSITSRNVGIISLNSAGTRVESAQKVGTNAVEYFHGIHNSENMPAGQYFRSTSTTSDTGQYEIGYPSDMRNCKVCHTSTAQLAAATTAPPSFWLCMSCHQTWDGFGGLFAVGTANDYHRDFTMATNCMQCHVDLPTKDQAGKFHNSFEGVDTHYDSFYGGTDISYDNPDNVSFAITGVSKSGDNVTFTWTASRSGAAVNPCNTTSTGASFQKLAAYLGYAKGDDWVNDNVVSSSTAPTPGQPVSSKNLFTVLATTCASNVATTTGLQLAAGTNYASKVLLAVVGKPVDNVAVTIGGASTTKLIYVRAPSQTYTFSRTSGAAVAARRNVVNTAKCLSCHRGTMFQHGGDRIDNPQVCVICHNPSAGDKRNRQELYRVVNADGTVNRDKTYDGKSDETWDLRTLLHAIHGADKREIPFVIYGSRSIGAFATPDAAKPTGWPTDNLTIFGSDNNSTKSHSWTVVDYPQPASKCLACHDAGTYEVADQTKAVGVTVEPGTSWSGQSDDVSIGPTAAACTACHATAIVRSHAQHEGYLGNILKEAMVDLAQPDSFWYLTP